jgi:DNA-binding transcriptional MerR regulator
MPKWLEGFLLWMYRHSDLEFNRRLARIERMQKAGMPIEQIDAEMDALEAYMRQRYPGGDQC